MAPQRNSAPVADAFALQQLLYSLGDAHVLVVGDVMLDRFVIGVVERISPEAPVPILRVQSEYSMVGGAGNVARNVHALGAKVSLLGVTGSDAAAAEIDELLAAIDGLTSYMVREPSRGATIKTRYYGDGRQLLRADREIRAAVAPETRQKLVDALARAMPQANAVIISDYAKGVVDPGLVQEVVQRAAKMGIPVLVDPKAADLSYYRGATVLTPNAKELAAATGLGTEDDAAVEAAARRAITAADAAMLVATRGAAGMTVVKRNGEVAHLRVRAKEVRDVSGAGDTVIATLAAALAVGADIVSAAELANAAAGNVVAKVGTQVPDLEEVRMGLYAREVPSAHQKIVDLAAALERVHRWRRNGETVAFTNGCFDLVHPGHVSLLAQARSTAHRLVVGLNADESVRRLKGEGRPIQSEAARAEVLASFATVDLVVLFAEDTPLRLITALRPDVLVKGADYTLSTVVGADLVQSWGGRVSLAQLVPGASSSSIVTRIGAGGAGARPKRTGSDS